MFRDLSGFNVLWEMALFLGVLVVGLVYVIRKGRASVGVDSFFANRTGFIATRLETVVNQVTNWGRQNSLWPYPFATACCGIEFMGVVSNVHDVSRFGAELVRFAPKQADLLVVAGTINHKMAPDPEADLRPDARAEVGHRVRRLRGERRLLRQLRGRAGHRPRDSGRRLPAGMPAAARGVLRGARAPPEEDPAGPGRSLQQGTRPADGARASESGAGTDEQADERRPADRSRSAFRGMCSPRTSSIGQATATIRPSAVRPVIEFLRTTAGGGFDFLVDLAGVDGLGLGWKDHRFEVVYQLRSMASGRRVRIKAARPAPRTPRSRRSTTSGSARTGSSARSSTCTASASRGHPNLKRILCHHRFVGHALRKDYFIKDQQWLDDEPESLTERDRRRRARIRTSGISELIPINIGPAHPATHGTLRVLAKLDGETIVQSAAEIGYLHRAFEKHSEVEHLDAGDPVHRPAELLLGDAQQRRVLQGGREAARHRGARPHASTSA